MRYAYPIDIEEADDGFTITCPDVPELITGTTDRGAILPQAQDALVAALSFYTDDGKQLPKPSPARGRTLVEVPLLVAAKLALHARKLELGLSDAEFGRRIGLDQKSASRLLDPLHRSHVGQVEAALAVLNKRLVLAVRDAA